MPKAIHAVTHVSPIADYEPPTFGGPPALPPVISLRRRQVPVRPVPAPAPKKLMPWRPPPSPTPPCAGYLKSSTGAVRRRS